eukprot:2578414-Amphidinium_carterae.1
MLSYLLECQVHVMGLTLPQLRLQDMWLDETGGWPSEDPVTPHVHMQAEKAALSAKVEMD